ncbi:MAG: alpha/beta hydrolase [Tannerella sp.]|jgi:alpha-beta hydrolase superfamily lysophospholipase|nr:alpha/beta hydrolase [Tannerella sp.]
MTYKKVNFNSKDGLKMTADFYEADKPKGFILLCHRSHCNRAEYRETAPKLNDLGYSCLAIDQRSGMKVFGETNETKDRAKVKGLPTGYLDAKPDIEAAIDYAYELNDKNKIILFGSSYSASLALLVSTQTDKIKATIAYSPGEYLKGVNLASEIKNIDKPTYVTSPKAEIQQVADLTKNVNPTLLTRFIPTSDGFHGSKTLWKEVGGHETYWTSLEKFLEKVT